jgi:hypothetical protein
MSYQPLDWYMPGLSLEEARALSDDELRDRFAEQVIDLEGSYGRKSLPETFPREPWSMPRDAMLAAIEEHAYWFDPPELRGEKGRPPEMTPELQRIRNRLLGWRPVVVTSDTDK